MQQSPYPAIHTAANARAEALGSEAAVLRAEADAMLSLIDELCGKAAEPVKPASGARNARRHAAA